MVVLIFVHFNREIVTSITECCFNAMISQQMMRFSVNNHCHVLNHNLREQARRVLWMAMVLISLSLKTAKNYKQTNLL